MTKLMTRLLPAAFGIAVLAFAPIHSASAEQCNNGGGRLPCAVTSSAPKVTPTAAKARGEAQSAAPERTVTEEPRAESEEHRSGGGGRHGRR